MNRRTYDQCGLRLRCEFPLDLPTVADGEWDIDVVSGDDIDDTTGPPPGEQILRYSSHEDTWYIATWTGTDYRFRFRDCGEIVISADLDRAVVRRDPTGNHSLLPILVAGTMAALVLTLRGQTVLHASAVEIDGGVLAFIGDSGSGKSTLAAMMCADGAPLVTDDLLTVRPGDPPTCRGGAHELRLRPAAAGLSESMPSARSRQTADDRTAVAVPAVGGVSRPLSAIVVPMPARDVRDLAVNRFSPSTALLALLNAPRVHGWDRPDVLTRDLAVLGSIANAIPVYAARIPWGPPFDPAIGPAIADLARTRP